MKKTINKILITTILFLLYLDSIVQDDLSVLNPIGRFFIKPAWFIRGIVIYLSSPILFMWFLIINTEIYKHIEIEFKIFSEVILTDIK